MDSSEIDGNVDDEELESIQQIIDERENVPSGFLAALINPFQTSTSDESRTPNG
jgi:hypothetical protein